MKVRMEYGLPLVSFVLCYEENTIVLENVLLDTGCATTIFDTDILAEVGIELDVIKGKPKRMYGVGGYSEPCYEQIVSSMMIDEQNLYNFQIQLGITKESYGFDGILGMDYMKCTGLLLDCKQMSVAY